MYFSKLKTSLMDDKTFVYLIVAIVVAHFIFAVGYLIWKISSAPKSKDQKDLEP